MPSRPPLLPTAWVVAALTVGSPAAGASVVVVIADGPGEGLNDPTPVAPVGGNPGTTLGQQRLLAIERAASIWGAALESPVPIRIDAFFDPLSCTASSAVLGSAAPIATFRNFAGAPQPDTWYAAALANSRAGVDLSASSDVLVRFNSGLGAPACFAGSPFYLGFDGNGGDDVDLITVALHELAHGLGFMTFVNRTTGEQLLGFPDAFESRFLDIGTGEHWPEMTPAERVVSGEHARFVVWDGPEVTARVPTTLTTGFPVLSLATLGELPVGLAQFGPPPGNPPLVADVVAVADGAGSSQTDACEPFGGVAGKLALVDRGNCQFVIKVKNAQNAGAAGVLVADNAPGSPPPGMAGVDPTIVIPSVRITQDAGAALRAALLSGPVTASLGHDPGRRVGADADDRVYLHTPQPGVTGSSLSHWDPLASPNLLMEPSNSPDLEHALDLTRAALADTGWVTIAATGVPALPRTAAITLGVVVSAIGLAALARRRGRPS